MAVWTPSDAKAIRAQAFIDRTDALEAAGLRGYAPPMPPPLGSLDLIRPE